VTSRSAGRLEVATLFATLFPSTSTHTHTPSSSLYHNSYIGFSFPESPRHLFVPAGADFCHVSVAVHSHEATTSQRGSRMPYRNTSRTQPSQLNHDSLVQPSTSTSQFPVCLPHRMKPFAKLVKTCSGRDDTTSRKIFSSIISLRMLLGKHCTYHVPCVFVYGYKINASVMENSSCLKIRFGQNSTP
jgi:hypothetical protein